MNLPIVAIVGRPNVGKSTLFNRIVGGGAAVVDDQPGVTRDRHYARANWGGHEFLLVDTGGLLPGAKDGIEAQVRRQVELALDEADVVVFLADVREGPVPADDEVADVLRRRAVPTILVANKVDGAQWEAGTYEFNALGIGEPISVSAEHGRLIGDLLDRIVEHLPAASDETEETSAIRVAVIGRPNVGKSSLVNRLLGEERMIVHDVPGTTRDSVDTRFQAGGRDFVLIDTAGLRRRSKEAEGPEYYSMVRTLRAVDRCDVALVLFDATEPLSGQDLKVATLPHEGGKSAIYLYNKWDLVEKDGMTSKRVEEETRYRLPLQSYVPVHFVSAKTGQRVGRLPTVIEEVYGEGAKRIPTSALNTFVRRLIAENSPPYSGSGKPVRIYYATQASVSPPTFILFTNNRDALGESYLRYLTNRLRDEFSFSGAPLRIRLRQQR
jgi:GTP-binding protein